MLQAYKILASVGGIGYIKGGGTLAALVACILWYLTAPQLPAQVLLIAAVTLVGVHTGNQVEKDWGKDSSKVVMDEVAGMFLSMLALPSKPLYILIAFVLFRVFDIAKPLYIRKIERFKGGWGVMLDDLLAGVYANILLQILVYLIKV